MYESVGAAVWAMVRWRERCRAAKAAPFPDHPPQVAAGYNRWRYLYVHSVHGATRPESEVPGDPETVMLLFDRYDRYRYLTRLFIEGKQLEDLPPRERRRARKASNHFARELCHRALLRYPRKTCPQNLHGQCPRFPRQPWAGEENP